MVRPTSESTQVAAARAAARVSVPLHYKVGMENELRGYICLNMGCRETCVGVPSNRVRQLAVSKGHSLLVLVGSIR